jgi:hypothetical protein
VLFQLFRSHYAAFDCEKAYEKRTRRQISPNHRRKLRAKEGKQCSEGENQSSDNETTKAFQGKQQVQVARISFHG